MRGALPQFSERNTCLSKIGAVIAVQEPQVKIIEMKKAMKAVTGKRCIHRRYERERSLPEHGLAQSTVGADKRIAELALGRMQIKLSPEA